MHLGVYTTQRVEGLHFNTVKSNLQYRNLDLFQVFSRVNEACLLQYNNIKVSYKVPTTFVRKGPKIHPSIEYLSNSVSKEAMILVSEQIRTIEKAMNGTEQWTLCTGKFTRTMGLPCWHTIMHIATTNEERKLVLSDFDNHWHLNKNPLVQENRLPIHQEFQIAMAETHQTFESCKPHEKEILLTALTPVRLGPVAVKNFEVARTLGRPKKDKSSKRDPSVFEISHGPTISKRRDLNLINKSTDHSPKLPSPKKPRKCGTCGEFGHDKRKCVKLEGPSYLSLNLDSSDSSDDSFIGHIDFLNSPQPRKWRQKGSKLQRNRKDCINCGGNHDDCNGRSFSVQVIADGENQSVHENQFRVYDGESRGLVYPDFSQDDKDFHG
jgi:hypothetical protein